MFTEGVIVLVLAAIGYDKAKKEKVDSQIINMHLGNIVMGSIMIVRGMYPSRLPLQSQIKVNGMMGLIVLILSAIGYSKAKKTNVEGQVKNMHLGNLIMGAYLVGMNLLGGAAVSYYNYGNKY